MTLFPNCSFVKIRAPALCVCVCLTCVGEKKGKSGSVIFRVNETKSLKYRKDGVVL